MNQVKPDAASGANVFKGVEKINAVMEEAVLRYDDVKGPGVAFSGGGVLTMISRIFVKPGAEQRVDLTNIPAQNHRRLG